MNFVYRSFGSFLLIILPVSFSFAQIPNPGFENWTAGTPDDWLTLNIPGVVEPVMQSATSHSGSYAVKGEVLHSFDTNVPPYLATDMFAISQNYTRMTGYYQFSNNGEDVLWANVQFLDVQDMLVAIGSAEFGETSGGYTQFIVNLDYTFGSDQPATQAFIWFMINASSESQADSATVGSYFLIDDLEFDNVSNISEGSFKNSLKSYHLAQNYPNPFNPSTKINFSLPQPGRVRLSVFNSLGQEVETLIDKDMPAGDHQITFNAGNFPSGIYFYKIESANFIDVKKMILIK